MRAVILGTDLMYDQSGRLVPIEINTNIGYDLDNRVESTNEWLDLSSLASYIKNKKFKRVKLDLTNGTFHPIFLDFKERLKAVLPNKVEVVGTDEDCNSVETGEDELYIRINFSEEALLDSYCRDKVSFLNLIYNSSKIAQEFLYKEDGEVKGTMKDFLDNGPNKPNYIVKFRYPSYSSGYPKYYKFNSLDEVYKFVESLEDGYLVMPCYLNEDYMYENERFILLRQWSFVVADEEELLKVIDLGTYTKLSGVIDYSLQKFNEETGELITKSTYLSKGWTETTNGVLLDDGDQVLMSDGTWKDIKNIKEGDQVLSVDVPHAEGVNIKKHTGSYKVDVEEFKKDSKFTVNEVSNKGRIEGFQEIVHMVFEEDSEEWYDTEQSSYPTIGENGVVRFRELRELEVGNVILLISLADTSEEVSFVERTIKEIWKERKLTTGYTLSVGGSHLFITKSPESTAGYISIEHNYGECRSCCVGLSTCNDFYQSLCGSQAQAEMAQEDCNFETGGACKLKPCRAGDKECAGTKNCWCICRT